MSGEKTYSAWRVTVLRDIVKLVIVIGLWAGFLRVILPLAEIGDYKIGYLVVFAIILFFLALTKELVKLPELDKCLETPGGLWATGIISVVVSVFCGIEFLHKLLFVRPMQYWYLIWIFQSVLLLKWSFEKIKEARSIQGENWRIGDHDDRRSDL